MVSKQKIFGSGNWHDDFWKCVQETFMDTPFDKQGIVLPDYLTAVILTKINIKWLIYYLFACVCVMLSSFSFS